MRSSVPIRARAWGKRCAIPVASERGDSSTSERRRGLGRDSIAGRARCAATPSKHASPRSSACSRRSDRSSALWTWARGAATLLPWCRIWADGMPPSTRASRCFGLGGTRNRECSSRARPKHFLSPREDSTSSSPWDCSVSFQNSVPRVAKSRAFSVPEASSSHRAANAICGPDSVDRGGWTPRPSSSRSPPGGSIAPSRRWDSPRYSGAMWTSSRCPDVSENAFLER